MKESESLKKRKIASIWEYWKRTPSNKRRWKKKKIRKEYFRRTWKIRETKHCNRNLIEGINFWVVPLGRFPGSFLKWIKKNSDKSSRGQENWCTKHRQTIYISRNEGGRGFVSIEDSANASIRGLENYIF